MENMMSWTVEAGREIHFNGKVFMRIDREGDTRPVEADGAAHLIADLFNQNGVTPDGIYERHMGGPPRRRRGAQEGRAPGKKGRSLTPAEKFFYDHAGFSYPSGADAAGRERAKIDQAKALARAEAEAEERGWTVEWSHSENPDTSWMNDEQLEDYESGRTEILDAVLFDEEGNVIGSLGEVGLSARGPRDPYGRVVEAELALEAL
jgi:hypothetical protein